MREQGPTQPNWRPRSSAMHLLLDESKKQQWRHANERRSKLETKPRVGTGRPLCGKAVILLNDAKPFTTWPACELVQLVWPLAESVESRTLAASNQRMAGRRRSTPIQQMGRPTRTLARLDSIASRHGGHGPRLIVRGWSSSSSPEHTRIIVPIHGADKPRTNPCAMRVYDTARHASQFAPA